jgi:hypothetical protein
MEDSRVFTLQDILALLDQYHQRATYGAVAGVLHVMARTVMGGHPRDHLHSWVVAQATGLPTGYTPAQCHPNLLERCHVIANDAELLQWLQNPH